MYMNAVNLNSRPFFLIGLLAVASLSGCQGPSKKYDTVSSGTVNISVDESYQPLIDSEIRVFEAQHPQAHIIAHYEPEADCFRDLLNDSSHLIIVTRGLNAQESQYFKQIQMPMTSKILAWDAVALIINPDNPDSNMTMK
ncbi:MAG: substrate-binding domain-containing protein, partial [Chitinophagaceae bacterium]